MKLKALNQRSPQRVSEAVGQEKVMKTSTVNVVFSEQQKRDSKVYNW